MRLRLRQLADIAFQKYNSILNGDKKARKKMEGKNISRMGKAKELGRLWKKVAFWFWRMTWMPLWSDVTVTRSEPTCCPQDCLKHVWGRKPNAAATHYKLTASHHSHTGSSKSWTPYVILSVLALYNIYILSKNERTWTYTQISVKCKPHRFILVYNAYEYTIILHGYRAQNTLKLILLYSHNWETWADFFSEHMCLTHRSLKIF